jgi:UDP-N-acetylmuramoyl-tripeptide--D-alanyl-D-alanine ligase
MKHVFKQLVVRVMTAEAQLLLRRTKPTIIAVTGSVGKTSTKDAIYTILKNHKRARKSQKSFNSEIGVPLSILGLPNAWSNPLAWLKNMIEGLFIALWSTDYPEVLILETGVDRPGDMAALTAWLKPHIVVITRLPDVPVHVEYFDSPEAVVREKLTLIDALTPDGVFIYNHDDEKLQMAAQATRQSTIGFSRYVPSHFTASKDAILYHDDRPVGSSFMITHFEETATLKVRGAVGTPAIYAYTAACAVAAQFTIPLHACVDALADHTATPGRLSVLPGIKGTVIIDDTYNSSPIAAEAALETLRDLKGFTRKIAVLGDMLELGRYSASEHERIGSLVPTAADILITVGVRSRATAKAALEYGMSEKVVYQYDDAVRAGRELQTLVKPGDVILVKASQGIRAERIVEEIMAEPERAGQLLVRQDSSWQYR